MAAYRRLYDSRHLQANCQEPGSAPEPYARYPSMGCLYLLHLLVTVALESLLLCYANNARRRGNDST